MAPERSSEGMVRLADAAILDGDTLRCALEPVGTTQTIAGLLERNVLRFADHAVWREKRNGAFEDVSWTTFLGRVVALAEHLRASGVGRGDRVAAVSRNRGELLVAEFAVMSMGAVFVPIFPGYSDEQTRGLLVHAGAVAVMVQGSATLRKIGAGGARERVIAFDPPGPAGAADVEYFADILGRAGSGEATASLLERLHLVAGGALDPHAPCLMMYTSGTAGEQKGVLLTHDNILSQQRALARIWNLGPGDRLLSYLPWHHSFGGIFEKYAGLYHGATVAIDESYGKDLPLLIENWKAIRPTVYFSVPLIHQELVNHVNLHPEDEERIYHPEIRFVFTAAAPLPTHVSDFLAARGIPVVEGWGLTETSPCCTLTDVHERRSVPGMVGYPIPGVRLGVGGDGEILVRGPNVMVGYHGNPEATRAALPGDGWFHTGDLGEFAGKGLRLLARKDRVFKLLNAEKVVPTLIENRLAGMNRYIRHVLVVGAAQDHLAALIFPNYPLIEKEFGDDWEGAVRAVKQSLLDSVLELNRTHPVRYEHLHAFAVVSRELTVEGGDLTPSMKLRVRNVLRDSRGYLEAIYDPREDCDCRFLGGVMRLKPDPRRCPRGKDLGLDRCHECGMFLTGREAV